MLGGMILRKSIIVAIVCASICSVATTTVNAETNDSDTNDDFNSWKNCLLFEVEKAVRIYGKSLPPEHVTDLVFLECKEIQNISEENSLNSFHKEEFRNKAIQLLKDMEISIHRRTVDLVKLLTKDL